MNNLLQTNPSLLSLEQTAIKEVTLINSKFILEQEDVALHLVNKVFTDLKKYLGNIQILNLGWMKKF